MGRRLRTHLAAASTPRRGRADVVVALRCGRSCSGSGPHVEDVEPVDRAARATGSTATSWSPRWCTPATGARTRSSTAARSASAGSIVDVFPSTADVPVRIDLWGDEVDRLTEFSVNDQRSTNDLDRGRDLPVPRAAADRRGARPGRARSSPREPWGREQWERLADGLTFDGMESWLPWLDRAASTCCSTCSPPTPRSCCVEPRRMRDRAADILAEEADLARTLAKTWGARRRRGELPAACTCRSTGCSRTPTRRRGPSPSRPRARRRHRRRRWAGTRSSATATRLVDAARATCCADGYRIVVARRRRGLGATRIATSVPARRRTGVDQPEHRGRAARAGLHPAGDQAGGAGRGRPHRPAPRPPPGPPARARDAAAVLRRPQARRLRRAPPARRRPLRRHGQAGHRRGRARLPAARVPRRRQALRPVRPDRRGPPLHRRRAARRSASSAAATGRRPRRGCAPRSPQIAQELVVLYQKRVHTPGPRLRRRHAVAARARGRLPVPGDARPAARPSTT